MHDHVHDQADERLRVIPIALSVIALGVSMWFWPDGVGYETTNGGQTLLKIILHNLWGPVTGAVLCLFGGLLGLGAVFGDNDVTSCSVSRRKA